MARITSGGAGSGGEGGGARDPAHWVGLGRVLQLPFRRELWTRAQYTGRPKPLPKLSPAAARPPFHLGRLLTAEEGRRQQTDLPRHVQCPQAGNLGQVLPMRRLKYELSSYMMVMITSACG